MTPSTETDMLSLSDKLHVLWPRYTITKAFVGRQTEAFPGTWITLTGRPAIPVFYRDLPHRQDVGLVMELDVTDGPWITLEGIRSSLCWFFNEAPGISLLGLWLPGQVIDRAGVPKRSRLWFSDRDGGCSVYRKRGEGLDVLLSQTDSHFISPLGLTDLGNGWGWE